MALPGTHYHPVGPPDTAVCSAPCTSGFSQPGSPRFPSYSSSCWPLLGRKRWAGVGWAASLYAPPNTDLHPSQAGGAVLFTQAPSEWGRSELLVLSTELSQPWVSGPVSLRGEGSVLTCCSEGLSEGCWGLPRFLPNPTWCARSGVGPGVVLFSVPGSDCL